MIIKYSLLEKEAGVSRMELHSIDLLLLLRLSYMIIIPSECFRIL